MQFYLLEDYQYPDQPYLPESAAIELKSDGMFAFDKFTNLPDFGAESVWLTKAARSPPQMCPIRKSTSRTHSARADSTAEF